MVWNGRFISLTTLSLTQLQINLFFNLFLGKEGTWHSSAQLVYATFHYAKSWWWGRRPHHQDFSGFLVSVCINSTDWKWQLSLSLYWINSKPFQITFGFPKPPNFGPSEIWGTSVHFRVLGLINKHSIQKISFRYSTPTPLLVVAMVYI